MNNQPRLCKKQNYIQFHNKNKFKTPSLAVGLTEGPPGPERAVETPPSSSTRGVSAVSTAPTLLPPPPPSPSSPSSSSWGHQVPSTVRAGENTLHGRVFEPATSAAGWWLTPAEMPSSSGSASWSKVATSSGSSPSSPRCNRRARQQQVVPDVWRRQAANNGRCTPLAACSCYQLIAAAFSCLHSPRTGWRKPAAAAAGCPIDLAARGHPATEGSAGRPRLVADEVHITT